MLARETRGDKIFNVINVFLMLLLVLCIVLPFAYLISVSISDPDLVLKGKVWLIPKNITSKSYAYVFKSHGFIKCYYNTIWYTVVGTVISLFMILITAYPLSRKRLRGRSAYNIYLLITMYFSGGMIPGYLLIRNLGLINTRWSLIIPGAVVAWYVILTRTFFESLPESLIESAKIDGASELKVLFSIILPLSKAIIAVIVLFKAVDLWNLYFTALIYLTDEELYPVQVLLQRILIKLSMDSSGLEAVRQDQREAVGQGVRYAMIIITILPILCIYPFIQKYFVKGLMIGAVKG